MSISPPRLDEHKQKPIFHLPSTRYHRPLRPAERERLDPILKQRINISFLSNKGCVHQSSYSLKNLQDYLIQKISIWSSEAEVFLIGSVASNVLQEAHGCKDIDLRVMLPQAIVDTAKSDLLVTQFLQNYAPQTKKLSWRPLLQVHTAPDVTSCTYQMRGLDLNFRARATACLSVNKSDGFAIRLSDRHVFCIDQQTYCSTQASFEEGCRQLVEKIYPLFHFQYLRGIEFRVLKKATLGYHIQEDSYFKVFSARIKTDYYLTDHSGKTVKGWQGRKEWLSSYKNHLQSDYPASIQGSERILVYLLDILNLLACMNENSKTFAEKLASVWGACLPGIRDDLTSPLYFLERYPEDTNSFLQLVQALVCCHHTYCRKEGRVLLTGYSHSYSLLLQRGGTLLTMQDLKEEFNASFDKISSLAQHNVQLLSSLKSFLYALNLPDIAWTDDAKSRYFLLLSWQTDPSIQQQCPDGISLLQEAFFHQKSVVNWSQEKHGAFLRLFDMPWMQPFLPTVIAQVEIAKTLEAALSAHKQIHTIHHQLIRTIGILLKHSTISHLPTLQLLREILADPLLEEAQQVQAAICDMTKTLEIPLLMQTKPKIVKHSKRRSASTSPPMQWKVSFHRIQVLFQSLENLRSPLHSASEEIRTITNKAQKNRWIFQKEQNTLLKKLVPFHLQARHHEEIEPFRVLTLLIQERLRVYAKRTLQKEYVYWESLCTAVARQCIALQIASLPFLKAPRRRLFYILGTRMSIQRALCIALQTNLPYSMKESQALLQACMKAPTAFISFQAREDLLDLGEFILDRYSLSPPHEELYITFSQLIALFLGQRHHSLQDLGYRLFCSLPHTPSLSSQFLKKCWTQHSKMVFSFLVKTGEYSQLSQKIPLIYAQLNYSHCFELTLHLQQLAIFFHLQLFTQLAETPLAKDKYPNGTIPCPDTQPWSLTSTDLHRLILQLNNAIILYEMHPPLFRNAIDLIVRLMIRTPDHSFDLIHDAQATLDKLYQFQKNCGCPAEEMNWYPKYNYSFAIHLHHLSAVHKNLLPLEGLAPRLAAMVPFFAKEMGEEDTASFIHSCLFFLRDFVLLSLIKDNPNIFISFLDRTIKPLLEHLRTSSLSPASFLTVSELLTDMCMNIRLLHFTIESIPHIFFPSTQKLSVLLFSLPKKPKLTVLKKKLESKLAFSTIKNIICSPSTDLKRQDLPFIGDAIRFYLQSTQYSDTSATNMKIRLYLHKTIFILFNRLAREEELPFFW